MSVDELLRALEREAEAEIAAILGAARAEADELDREGARRTQARADAAVARARARTQATIDADVAEARRRRGGDVLVRRAAALDRVRAATRVALPGLLEADDVVDALVASVVAALAGGAAGEATETVTLRCPPTLVAAVRRRLSGRPDIIVIADEAIGPGLLAERAGGRVTIDARLTTFLERWWPGLRLAIRPAERP